MGEFAKQMGSEEELVLMNDSLDLMLKSRCKKTSEINYEKTTKNGYGN